MIHQVDLDKIASLLNSNRMPQCLLLDTSRFQNFSSTELRQFAQGYYCENGNTCGQCDTCRRVMRDEEPDLLIVDGHEGTIKIADARALIEHLQIMPQRKVRMVAIHEAEKLSLQAANALLKTMEEPSSAAQFVLTSDRIGSLPDTVRSRCVVWRLKPGASEKEEFSDDEILSQKKLQEKIEIFFKTENDAKALSVAHEMGAGLTRGLDEFLGNVEIFLNRAYKQGMSDAMISSIGVVRNRRGRLQSLRKFGVQKKIALNINLSIECTRGMD